MRKAQGCRLKTYSLYRFQGFPGEADLPHSNLYGGLAQLVERLPCKQEVSGSNPLISTIWVASSAG